MTLDNNVVIFFKDVYAFVEANSYEHTQLWSTNSSESNHKWWNGVNWSSKTSVGYLYTVGYINKRPIVISVIPEIINNKKVIFWKITSELADFKMTKDWLRKYSNKEHPPIFTDAMNFHLAIYKDKSEK